MTGEMTAVTPGRPLTRRVGSHCTSPITSHRSPLPSFHPHSPPTLTHRGGTTMEKMTVAQARRAESAGRDARVQGWVRTRRDSKGGFSFIEINDGSCFGNVQVIAESSLPNYQSEVLHLGVGASVTVEGPVQASPAKGQATELRATRVVIHGGADPAKYPLQKKGHSMEFLREIAHLRPRSNTFGAVMRIRHQVCRSIHEFYWDNGFYYIHPPIITSSDAEGAGQMFRVTTFDVARPPRNEQGEIDFSKDFFGRGTFLTVSGQLEAEALACSLGKVYTFGPTFRAENSNTSRHLAEFWMVEPEMAFYELTDNMDLAEAFLKRVFTDVLARCGDDMQFFNDRIEKTA